MRRRSVSLDRAVRRPPLRPLLGHTCRAGPLRKPVDVARVISAVCGCRTTTPWSSSIGPPPLRRGACAFPHAAPIALAHLVGPAATAGRSHVISHHHLARSLTRSLARSTSTMSSNARPVSPRGPTHLTSDHAPHLRVVVKEEGGAPAHARVCGRIRGATSSFVVRAVRARAPTAQHSSLRSPTS